MKYTAHASNATPKQDAGRSDRAELAKLARAGRGGIVSVPAAAAALGVPTRTAALRLRAFMRRGWLARARRGLYLILPLEAEPGTVAAEDPWVLAREAFAPCYIGGWSAAEHWGLTEQLFRTTLVVTSAHVRVRAVDLLGASFRLFRVPRPRVASGTTLVWRSAERVAVSTRERTLVDCLRNPKLCGGIRHLAEIMVTYGSSSERDLDALMREAQATASGAAWKRLGYLAERLWPSERKLIEEARKRRSSGNARLDPAVSRRGKLLRRWRLWVNVAIGAPEGP